MDLLAMNIAMHHMLVLRKAFTANLNLKHRLAANL